MDLENQCCGTVDIPVKNDITVPHYYQGALAAQRSISAMVEHANRLGLQEAANIPVSTYIMHLCEHLHANEQCMSLHCLIELQLQHAPQLARCDFPFACCRNPKLTPSGGYDATRLS